MYVPRLSEGKHLPLGLRYFWAQDGIVLEECPVKVAACQWALVSMHSWQFFKAHALW
jgi:hypothetical protein